MDIRRSYAPPSVIKTIQRGTANLSGAQNLSVTVSAVNMSKSKLRLLGARGGTTVAEQAVSVVLASSTSIDITRGTSSGTSVIAWELDEYY